MHTTNLVRHGRAFGGQWSASAHGRQGRGTPGSVLRWFFLIYCGFCWPLAAEDRVTVQGTRGAVKGLIVDYTGEQLTIRTGPMAEIKSFPAANVISVETEYLPEHSRGLELLAARKIREAEVQFTLALEDEDRKWVRREILAALVRCALMEDDLRKAALRFAPLVESDPRTRHWGLAPLVWDVEAVPIPSEADARTLLVSGGRATPLIAASWNLERNGHRSAEAEAELQKLAADADVMLQRLAQMQLLRARLAAKSVTINEIRRWEATAEELPFPLRAGAHVLLGEAAWQQQDALKAAAEWMWLPLHYADQSGLAAWAQLRAATALQSAGETDAGDRLLREVAERFPNTKAAQEATRLLKQKRP